MSDDNVAETGMMEDAMKRARLYVLGPELLEALKEMLVVSSQLLADYLAECRRSSRLARHPHTFDPDDLLLVKTMKSTDAFARRVIAKVEA